MSLQDLGVGRSALFMGLHVLERMEALNGLHGEDGQVEPLQYYNIHELPFSLTAFATYASEQAASVR